MATITMPATIDESDSFVGRLTEGFMNGWTGDPLTGKQAFAGSCANVALGIVAGGVFARKRAAKGLKPIAGFLL